MHSAWMLGGDEGKARSSSPHSLLALADAPGVPTQREVFAEAPSPPTPPPLTLSAKCKAQNIWAYLFYVCLFGLRAFEQKQGDDREKFTPGDLHTAATINSVTLRATLFPCESVGAIHHPTALPSSHRAHSLDKAGQKINPPVPTRF